MSVSEERVFCVAKTKIKAYYYSVKIYKLVQKVDGTKEEKLVVNKFTDLLSELRDKDVMDRVMPKTSGYDEVRLQKLTNDNGLWTGQFVKVRDGIIPNIVSQDGEFKPVVLETGEYIGEDAAFLYDESSKVLSLQRNFYSVSDKVVGKYFSFIATTEDEEYRVELIPYINKNRDGNKLANVILRCFDITCVNVAPDDYRKIINSDDDSGAEVISIHYSVGRHANSHSSLNIFKFQKILSWATEDKGFRKIRGKIK